MKDLAGIAANLVGAEVAKGAVIGAAVGVALNPNQGDIIRSIAVGAGLGVALAWGKVKTTFFEGKTRRTV